MDLYEEYDGLIEKYRQKMQELRKAERKHEPDDVINFIDKEKNLIHKQLRAIAPKIRKTAEDISLDILSSERNLSEYQLPEFKVVRTNDAMPEITNIFQQDENREYIPFRKEEKERIFKTTAFIPFGQQELWHLSDEEGYPMRQPTELECRRRIAKLTALMNNQITPVEIYSYQSFHTGTILFGVAFDPAILDQLLATMYEHRPEISIDKQFFNKKQIEDDMLQMIKEDIEHVLDMEPSLNERKEYILERLKSEWRRNLNFSTELIEKTNNIFEQAKKEGRELERTQAEEEKENRDMKIFDKVSQQYPKETSLPTKQSMRKN